MPFLEHRTQFVRFNRLNSCLFQSLAPWSRAFRYKSYLAHSSTIRCKRAWCVERASAETSARFTFPHATDVSDSVVRRTRSNSSRDSRFIVSNTILPPVLRATCCPTPGAESRTPRLRSVWRRRLTLELHVLEPVRLAALLYPACDAQRFHARLPPSLLGELLLSDRSPLSLCLQPQLRRPFASLVQPGPAEARLRIWLSDPLRASAGL
ncbi:hypothetical protein BamMC406_6712 (plasmid) [Burkholderia ambifaria MC40-6]|uniref:Uncharacterized protein n=1 Tax=Burkholderia ambifaria (strain MC40-6) TaxID=398577 RepID=B1Z6N7_BURA4|nr:hypothetical protein BamMC406_6712 [Burkholderia ambifaria MC40-6]